MATNDAIEADLLAQVESDSEDDSSSEEGGAEEGEHDENLQRENSAQRPPSSLLDLILTQQNDGDPGVRLEFHNELAIKLSMNQTPYFYCGLHGLANLAAYLHSRGLRCERVLTIASFSSGGANNDCPWEKGITVSASETAKLAGHPQTALVLQHIEQQVPLHWSPSQHSAYPDSFKSKMRPVVDALCSCNYFVALPGPARVAIVDLIASEAARDQFWTHISCTSGIWGGPRVVEEAHAAAWAVAENLPVNTSPGKSATEDQMPIYNFRMKIGVLFALLVDICSACVVPMTSQLRRHSCTVRPMQLRRFVRIMFRATAGSAAVHLSQSFGCAALLPNAGIFLAAFASPVPAALVMTSIKLHQMHQNSGKWRY